MRQPTFQAICFFVFCFANFYQLIAPSSAQEQAKEITNSVGMKLVLIPKGTFTMGSPASEKGRLDIETPHQVTISRDYYLGITEVTQAQYQKVIGQNPSDFQGDRIEGDSSNHPVERVSWGDAVEFCKRLSELPEEKKAGRVYRLPTEAEWEYACRAGSKTAYCFGDDLESLDQYAWFGARDSGHTQAVGQKKPNAWGLYDMHGNVLEWCADSFALYPDSPLTDPTGASDGAIRIFRGGSWLSKPAFCRSAVRDGCDPSVLLHSRDNGLGFRAAMSQTSSAK